MWLLNTKQGQDGVLGVKYQSIPLHIYVGDDQNVHILIHTDSVWPVQFHVKYIPLIRKIEAGVSGIGIALVHHLTSYKVTMHGYEKKEIYL